MNQIAEIGHNGAPSPIDEVTAPFADFILEAENWLDGTKVETAEQMEQVDTLLAGIKLAAKAVEKAQDAQTKPLHKAWQDEIKLWKPTITDLDRLKDGLVALVSDFKRRLAAEKAEAARLAREAAAAALRTAQEASAKADPTNIESQRAAEQAQAEAKTAKFEASAASKDKVKGLRTVQMYEIDDRRQLLNWIAKNRTDDLVAFIDEWASKHYKDGLNADGLRVWQEKVAY